MIGDSCVTSNTPGKIAPFVDTLDMVKNIDIFYLDINPNDLLKPNVDSNHINPNIDDMKPKLGDGLVLAAGGCGHAAKGADEIGETFFLMRSMRLFF